MIGTLLCWLGLHDWTIQSNQKAVWQVCWRCHRRGTLR
jgi:hypothetical protein